jgi:hypothetical protein
MKIHVWYESIHHRYPFKIIIDTGIRDYYWFCTYFRGSDSLLQLIFISHLVMKDIIILKLTSLHHKVEHSFSPNKSVYSFVFPRITSSFLTFPRKFTRKTKKKQKESWLIKFPFLWQIRRIFNNLLPKKGRKTKFKKS